MIRIPGGSSAVRLHSRTIVLSGTVKTAFSDPLYRRVIAYKNYDETTVVASTYSSIVDGSFSMTVNAGPNDYFTVIALPNRAVSTENARVFTLVNENN